MGNQLETLEQKLSKLSPGLRTKIRVEGRNYQLGGENGSGPTTGTPVSDFLVSQKKHCNGGRTVDAGLWLRDHCKSGGKIFLTMAGAGSSFELGIPISELIRAGHIAGISVTGANLEESLYRLLANDHYANIPDYDNLTPEEEKELDRVGFRRITDTFLPEEETVRMVLPRFEELWRDAEKTGNYLLWHEYFFKVLEEMEMLGTDKLHREEDCWLYTAWKHDVPIFVPGVEDSTLGNIFAYYSYGGDHPFLSRYKQEKPISPDVVNHSFRYMHRIAEWYMDSTAERSHAFLQLGGGIAGDFPICVVPHIKKDFLDRESPAVQERNVPTWAGFVEIHSSPMSFGSYSGAGGKEKITWSKLEPNAPRFQIFGDYTEHFPDIAALILKK